MPATVTLATTTLAEGVDASSGKVKLTSTSGVTPGTGLYIDGELMKAISLDVDSWVHVKRGESSAAAPHPIGDTVYIGRMDQFYSGPPNGRPNAAVAVSPYIDVVNGKMYFAQGDTYPSTSANRWWQEVTTTYTSGPLGIRTTTLDPSSST
jgi:hypothetical protein